MPNFSMQIRGEAEPRGFRYDIEENALYTDIEIENKRGGMEDQRQLKITESTAQTDPQSMMYWEQTAVYRETYRICEEEGLAFEEAFEKALSQQNGGPPPPYVSPEAALQRPNPTRGVPEQDFDPPDTQPPEPEASSDPIAVIGFMHAQLLNGFLISMLEQYVTEDDKNHKLFEHCKKEKEKIDGYEIII